ncbi:MAG: RIP metalloprotease RseP [Lachnospiraceae bacterium]
MKIVIAILIFSVIVLIHELGHFLLAKKNHIVVLEFSLGMGPRLLSRQIGETRYSVKLLPIGGSCMMLGEDEDDDLPGTFSSAPVWGRISVVAAGPVFNFILAFLLSIIVIATIGFSVPKVAEINEESPAYEAGLRDGDTITKFQGCSTTIAKELSTYLLLNPQTEGEVTVVVERNGISETITYLPETSESYILGFTYGDGEEALEITSVSLNSPMADAGVQAGDILTGIDGTSLSSVEELTAYLQESPFTEEPVSITYTRNGREHSATLTPQLTTNVDNGYSMIAESERGNVGQVLYYAGADLKYWVSTTIETVAKLFTGEIGINSLSGPVGVVNAIGDTYEYGQTQGTVILWMSMVNMMILLSANLGVMNLLPIPALDGGRLVFLLLEAIRRKPINRKIEGYIHTVGIVLLLALMAFVFFQDIIKLI